MTRSNTDSAPTPTAPTVFEKVIVAGSRANYRKFSLSEQEATATVARALYAAGIDRSGIDAILHGNNYNSPDAWGAHYADYHDGVENRPYTPQWQEFPDDVIESVGEDNLLDHPLVGERYNGDLYYKPAGPQRNSEMRDDGDALIAFWDGDSPGTKDMIDKAEEAGLYVFVVRLDTDRHQELFLPDSV